MTSFTKALYHRDPGAAKELRRHQLRYGRHTTLVQFTLEAHQAESPAFGRRTPTGAKACEKLCGHPACAQGCTLAFQRR